jgi:predicted DCC family thiol-disulfide oxidoreductase YuxK
MSEEGSKVNGSSKVEGPVLLFDGVCNLCNRSVQFILKNEKNRVLKFTAIQSSFGKRLLSEYNIDPVQTDSVILVKDGKMYTRSDAVLSVTSYLRFPYRLGRVFVIVPKPLRDLFYKQVARNRYHWFGKRDHCMLPTPELKKRFLE